MIVAYAVAVISALLLLAACFLRARSGLRAAVVVVLALAGLTAWAPARGAAASVTAPQSVTQLTTALMHPLAASHARATGGGFAPAVVTYNPSTPSLGFGVF